MRPRRGVSESDYACEAKILPENSANIFRMLVAGESARLVSELAIVNSKAAAL